MGASGLLHATSAFVDHQRHLLVVFHTNLKSRSLIQLVAARLSMLVPLLISKGGIQPPDSVPPRTELSTTTAVLQRAGGVRRRQLIDRYLRSSVSQAPVRATRKGKGRAIESLPFFRTARRILAARSTRRRRTRTAVRRVLPRTAVGPRHHLTEV